jgi:hypothetical protein
MQRHLASSFISITKLLEDINGVTNCVLAKASLILNDNYSKNQVLLHFANIDSNLEALKALKLKPSFMLKSPILNQKVQAMTTGLHALIGKDVQ